jgi:sulfur carrier protein
MGIIRVNNQYEVAWRPGMTVQDVLDELKFSFRMIAVKVNGDTVLRPDYATTPVPDSADVQAIHLTSGG